VTTSGFFERGASPFQDEGVSKKNLAGPGGKSRNVQRLVVKKIARESGHEAIGASHRPRCSRFGVDIPLRYYALFTHYRRRVTIYPAALSPISKPRTRNENPCALRDLDIPNHHRHRILVHAEGQDRLPRMGDLSPSRASRVSGHDSFPCSPAGIAKLLDSRLAFFSALLSFKLLVGSFFNFCLLMSMPLLMVLTPYKKT
jgi:hypothetical protein